MSMSNLFGEQAEGHGNNSTRTQNPTHTKHTVPHQSGDNARITDTLW